MNKLDISNRVKQPSQCCIYCSKSYVKRINLDRHITICELLQKSKKSSFLIEDEQETLPSQYKMFQMLIELGKKYNKLEEKVEDMEKWIVKKKKKINMVDWLNANIFPNIIFENIIDKIIITDEDIQYLFKNNFYDCLNEIFSKTIYNLTEVDSPIFAFVQKTNIFYIYEKLEGEKNIWIEISREKIMKFMNKVHAKLVKSFSQWKKDNSNEIKKNDHIAINCDKTLVKLMAIDFKNETTLSKVKSLMFSNMKKDLKVFVEFEFEF